MRSRHSALLLAFPLAVLLCRPASAQRFHHTITLLHDGRILVVGGANDANIAHTSVVLWRPDGEAVAANPLNVARASHTATLLPDGRVLVAGGVNAAGTIQNTAEVYDPVAGNWTNTANTMSSARTEHTANLLPNGKVLLCGGRSAAAVMTNSCDIFDPANLLTPFSTSINMNMKEARSGHTATLLYNGKVFVTGGSTSTVAGFANSTELYDPQSGTWAPGPSLIQKRAYHTATALGNHNVLIAGGFNGKNGKENQGYLQTAEIYNPVSDSITPADSMQERRMFHSSTLRPDGSVNIAGGLGNIATSYATPLLSFQAGSSISVRTVVLTTGAIDPDSVLNLVFDANLSVKANGIVADGDVYFSKPRAVLSDADVRFADNSDPVLGTKASLNGKTIRNGQITRAGLTLTAPGGSIITTPQDVPSNSVLLSAGNLTINPDPLLASKSGAITNGTLSGTIDVAMPSYYVDTRRGYSRIVSGTASILYGGGTITQSPSATTLGFNIALDSGTASITNGQVRFDGNGSAHLSMAVVFTGIQGRITNSTSTNITSADLGNMSNLSLSNLNLRLRYVVDYVNMKDFQFQFDIATVTIRRMVFSDVEQYSPKDNGWSFDQDPLGTPQFNHSTVLRPDASEWSSYGRTCASDGICGSFQAAPTARTVIIQRSSNWTSNNQLNAQRANHTATLLPSGKVLLAGGVNRSGVMASSELYDPETKRWTASGVMNQARNLHTATLLLDGTVLAAGGFRTGTSTGATSSAEIYYPDSGAWVPTASMNDARSYHTSALLPDGNVLVAGGYDAGGNYLNTSEVYISTGRVWRRAGNLNNARAQHIMTLLPTGEALLAGGLNPSILSQTETFNPQTGVWTSRASMNTQRHSHGARLLQDGRVLVSGGDDGFGEIGSAEVYYRGTDQWVYTQNLPLTSPNGNNMALARLKHNAVLLPNGKIVLVGGVQALGGLITLTEGYSVADSSWQAQGSLITAREHHTTTLLKDGNLLTAGGFDGLDYLETTEMQYFSYTPDIKSPPPSLRKPTLQEIVPSSFTRGAAITVKGSNFTGLTEASSGRGSIQSASLPRLVLQKLDSGGSNTQAESGFEADITTVIYAGSNLWQNMGTSITFTVPASTGLLPNGWYHLRVAANAQYSDSLVVQVAPPKPIYAPGIPYPRDYPSGTLPPNVSSVTWTWTYTAVSTDTTGKGYAACDFPDQGLVCGYHIYSSTNGVFLGTSAVNSFLQTGLGPDTQASIKVAAFSIAGDGPVSLSTTSLVTQSSEISGLRGAAKSASSIEWSWNSNQTALAYKVYTTTGSNPVAQMNTNSFLLTGLSTNTLHGVYVQVVSAGGSGLLSAPATAYTMAVIPLAAVPPLDRVSSGSFLASWTDNTNPMGTRYVLEAATAPAGAPIITSTVTALQYGVTSSSVTPNIRYYARVAAMNGDGLTTSFAPLGSTVTLAREPASLAVSFADPSSVGLAWSNSNNSSLTTYQILYSTDNFSAHVVTHTAFSSGFTNLSAAVSGLVTSTTYFFRVSARNQFGSETAYASVQAYTSGGGGPPGTLTFTALRDQGTSISGTIFGSSTRSITMRIPARSFDSDVVLYISSQSLATIIASGGVPCGSTETAVSITPSPSIQPRSPLEIGISYTANEVADPKTLAIGRVQAGTSRECVPLPSRVDTANRMVYAITNHLSDFQLMQLTPKSTIDGMRVFPNPLYTRNQGYFTFDRLPSDARVRVYTLHGEELYDARTNPSGVATWDARNKAGRAVASGVYLAVIEGSGGKKLLKLAVIR